MGGIVGLLICGFILWAAYKLTPRIALASLIAVLAPIYAIKGAKLIFTKGSNLYQYRFLVGGLWLFAIILTIAAISV